METLFPQKESPIFQSMFVKHVLEEGRLFLLEAPHPAPPSGKKLHKLRSSTQGSTLAALRIRSDLGREWYDRSYHPLSEVPWATSFCGRRSHTTLVASPMTVIIMHQVQRMIDHMELEPECLAPCVLVLKNYLFPKKQKMLPSATELQRGGVAEGGG